MLARKSLSRITGYLVVCLIVLSFISGSVFSGVQAQTGGDTIFLPIMTNGDPLDITFDPSALIQNVAQDLKVYVTYPYDASQDAPEIILLRTDADGKVLETMGSPTDDGDLYNGDEIAFDGVFSFLKKNYLIPDAGMLYFRVEILKGGDVADYSGRLSLEVMAEVTQTEWDQILDTQDAAADQYSALVGGGTDPSSALQQVLSGLNANPAVEYAGVSESGNGIWLVWESGILGGLMLNPEGTKGFVGSEGFTGGAEPSQDTTYSFEQALEEAYNCSSTDAATTLRPQNRKAIVLGAFYWQFLANDDAPEVRNILFKSKCPKFEIKEAWNADVTVDLYKTLHEYGTVVISTHGDTFYDGLPSWLIKQWGWNYWGGQVVFFAGEQATTANRTKYQADLLSKRLAVYNTTNSAYFGVLPSFVTHYSSTNFPDSLIYMSSCRSLYNDSMANAFLGKGAKTFLGYDNYVNAAFAKARAIEFFTRWVIDPAIKTTGDAFIPGQKDAKGTEFEIRGAADLHIPSSEIENGDFELGVMGAWTKTGDGRVIGQLGGFSPKDGKFMGIISTGLGFTTQSGSLEQEICLDKDAKKLEFWWNFSSAEFLEYCNSIFQDKFEVSITTATGTTVLFSKAIDGLCSSVFATTLVFDRDGVYSTGWLHAALDVSALATANEGKPVKLKFYASDVGDSIYDTAILLDGIKITK